MNSRNASAGSQHALADRTGHRRDRGTRIRSTIGAALIEVMHLVNAGKLRACRRPLLVAYAVVVILLTPYPWNVLLLGLIAAHGTEQMRGKRLKAESDGCSENAYCSNSRYRGERINRGKSEPSTGHASH